MTLTEFLLARIDEDEKGARYAIVEPDGKRYIEPGAWYSPASGVIATDDDLIPIGDSRVSQFIVEFNPARVLAECAAKRAIVTLHSAELGQHPDFCGHDLRALPCPTLRLLARPYAEHPDYDEAWWL